MEGLIALLVFYLISQVFRAGQKNKKGTPGRQAPAGKRPPGQTGRPATKAPAGGKSQPSAEELEQIPKFLRDFLGIEIPEAPPKPVPKLSKHGHPISDPDEDLDITSRYEGPPDDGVFDVEDERRELEDMERRHHKREEVVDFTEVSRRKSLGKHKKEQHSVTALLQDRTRLQEAYLLREILDVPVSKRPQRFPYKGNI